MMVRRCAERSRLVLISFVLLLALAGVARADGLKVIVRDAGELGPWSEKASTYMISWYPRISKFMGREAKARTIRLVFKRGDFVANAKAGTITVSRDYVTSNPDDFGMLAHELTHVIQAYPPHSEGWLTEGLADYVRYYFVEPGSPRAHFDKSTDTYRRGYQPAAAMLDWLARTHGRKSILALDKALRTGRYSNGRWRSLFGAEPDETWRRYQSRN